MTLPPRLSELNERPEDFNIPKDVSDSYFRQITKVGPNASSSLVKQFPAGNPRMHEFEYPVYENHPLLTEDKQSYLQTPQASWWKKLRSRMNESYNQGERGTPGYQQHADDSHHNGHWAVHMDLKSDAMFAYDKYLDLRYRAENKYHTTGEIPSIDETNEIKKAREDVDTKYQKMHDHLHGTCFRSEIKGGPCGYWGLPRGRDNCEYCRAGNPVRLIGDPMRMAAVNDDWSVSDEEPTSSIPAKSKSEIGKTDTTKNYHPELSSEPFRKPVEVPEDLKKQIPTVPGANAAFSPTHEPLPGNRMLMIQDPETEHYIQHLQVHGQLYSHAAAQYDEYLKAREHYNNLEELVGSNPDERQQNLLKGHREHLQELHDVAHEAWHSMHDYWHSDCPECTNWFHPRGNSCPHCKEGCPLCESDDPKKLSSITSWY